MGATRARRRYLLAAGSALAVATLVSGCSGSAGSSSRSDTGGASAAEPAPASAAASPGGLAPAKAGGVQDSAGTFDSGVAALPDALAGRDVIRTASLTVRVPKVLTGAGSVSQAAAAEGGFVAGEQTTADPDHPDHAQAVVTVRVPSTRMPALLARLHALGDLLAEEQDASDVTAQVVDVQARLSTQAASVTRVRALLAQATSLGQVVQIEGELAKREAQLESLQAQAKKLGDQTSLATVTVTLVGPSAVAPAPPQPAATGFGAGLSKGWHAFVTATTWLLTAVGAVLPFALLLALVGVPLWLAARRRRQQPGAPAPEPPAPAAV